MNHTRNVRLLSLGLAALLSLSSLSCTLELKEKETAPVSGGTDTHPPAEETTDPAPPDETEAEEESETMVGVEGDTDTEPETEAETVYSQGLGYTLLDDGTYEVRGIGSCQDTALVIPLTYEGKVVTGIGSSAFSFCFSLTSITLPDGVTSIGNYAFNGCSGLTSITLPDGVTSIGNGAFSGCSGLTSITLPDGVTSIGKFAFSYCYRLTSITLPDGVTSIGDYAFRDCSGLASVSIPSSVTSIGGDAFSDCSGLTDIYYTGTEDQWNAIEKGSGWDSAYTVHYNHVPS